MTASEFLRALAGGDSDIMQEVLDILSETGTEYCTKQAERASAGKIWPISRAFSNRIRI